MTDSAFDAVVRLPGRTVCIFRVGFKTDEGHREFLSNFCNKPAVTINGKEIAIRVRDRTLNLIRVRVHNFKFSDDLGALEVRMRQYGRVSKAFWDTYQDRTLPKWSGIKTGVVNVDMEIHDNIPSYIKFGSYKQPLMIEYAGQLKTCRICDSTFHISSVCPKLASSAAPQHQPIVQAGTSGSYSRAVVQPAPSKSLSSGWQTKVGTKTVDVEEPSVPSVASLLDQAPLPTSETAGSSHSADESFSDSEPEKTGYQAVATEGAGKKRKKKYPGSKEYRDQEKQKRKGERRGSQVPLLEQASPGETLENLKENLGEVQITPDSPEGIFPDKSANDHAEPEMDVEYETTLENEQSSPVIPAGQAPRHEPFTQGNMLSPLGNYVTTPLESTGPNVITDITRAGLEAFHKKKHSEKQKSRQTQHNPPAN